MRLAVHVRLQAAAILQAPAGTIHSVGEPGRGRIAARRAVVVIDRLHALLTALVDARLQDVVQQRLRQLQLLLQPLRPLFHCFYAKATYR